jgi:hypothetical protein
MNGAYHGQAAVAMTKGLIVSQSRFSVRYMGTLVDICTETARTIDWTVTTCAQDLPPLPTHSPCLYWLQYVKRV